MLGKLELKDLSLVILTKINNPSILSSDFLKSKEIVPENWDVDTPTFITEELSQVVYKNRVSISAQFDRLIFSQSLEIDDETENFIIPEMALKYLEALPHFHYYALGLNPLAGVVLNNTETYENYVKQFLLRSGDWMNFNGSEPIYNFTFGYKLSDCNLTVSLSSGKKTTKNKNTETLPIVLFSGNIHRHFEDNINSKNKLDKIKSFLKDYQLDLSTYKNLIEQCFLAKR